MEKKEIMDKVIEILSKHEEHTSEGGIYWEYEWVGGKQIPDGIGGYKQIGGEMVSAEEAFYKEMTDFISQELDKAREEGNEELSEAMIKYLENMIVLVGAFNPMSEVIKARQEGELEAYKGILSKLKQ